MKRFILIAFFSLSGIISQDAFSQESSPSRASSTERQLAYFQTVENGIFNLPFDFDYIQNEFIPEIMFERANLAPNYPDLNTSEREINDINAPFIEWMSTYPDEYLAYLKYLIQFIEDHK